MLARFDLVTATPTDANALVCADYAPSTRLAFETARAAGSDGQAVWSLGQLEVGAGDIPFTVPPEQAWDIRGHRAAAFQRGQQRCDLLHAAQVVVPAGVTTSAALLARLPEDAALAERRALLMKDTQSAFPVQILQGQGDLWAVPQEQPVRVRPSPD